MLRQLTVYHSRTSTQADNILTEKASGEVAEVVNDLSQTDDVSRSFLWLNMDEARLNELNPFITGGTQQSQFTKTTIMK